MKTKLQKYILITLPIILFTSCSTEYKLKQKIAHKWYFDKIEYSISHKEFLTDMIDSNAYIIFNVDKSVVMYNNFTKAEFEMGNWSVRNDSLVIMTPQEHQAVPITYIDESRFEFPLQLKDEPETIDIKLKRKN